MSGEYNEYHNSKLSKETTLVSIGGEIREAVIGGNYWPEWPAHVVGLVAHPLFKPSVKHHVLAVAAYEN